MAGAVEHQRHHGRTRRAVRGAEPNGVSTCRLRERPRKCRREVRREALAHGPEEGLGPQRSTGNLRPCACVETLPPRRLTARRGGWVRYFGTTALVRCPGQSS